MFLKTAIWLISYVLSDKLSVNDFVDFAALHNPFGDIISDPHKNVTNVNADDDIKPYTSLFASQKEKEILEKKMQANRAAYSLVYPALKFALEAELYSTADINQLKADQSRRIKALKGWFLSGGTLSTLLNQNDYYYRPSRSKLVRFAMFSEKGEIVYDSEHVSNSFTLIGGVFVRNDAFYSYSQRVKFDELLLGTYKSLRVYIDIFDITIHLFRLINKNRRMVFETKLETKPVIGKAPKDMRGQDLIPTKNNSIVQLDLEEQGKMNKLKHAVNITKQLGPNIYLTSILKRKPHELKSFLPNEANGEASNNVSLPYKYTVIFGRQTGILHDTPPNNSQKKTVKIFNKPLVAGLNDTSITFKTDAFTFDYNNVIKGLLLFRPQLLLRLIEITNEQVDNIHYGYLFNQEENEQQRAVAHFLGLNFRNVLKKDSTYKYRWTQKPIRNYKDNVNGELDFDEFSLIAGVDYDPRIHQFVNALQLLHTKFPNEDIYSSSTISGPSFLAGILSTPELYFSNLSVILSNIQAFRNHWTNYVFAYHPTNRIKIHPLMEHNGAPFILYSNIEILYKHLKTIQNEFPINEHRTACTFFTRRLNKTISQLEQLLSRLEYAMGSRKPYYKKQAKEFLAKDPDQSVHGFSRGQFLNSRNEENTVRLAQRTANEVNQAFIYATNLLSLGKQYEVEADTIDLDHDTSMRMYVKRYIQDNEIKYLIRIEKPEEIFYPLYKEDLLMRQKTKIKPRGPAIVTKLPRLNAGIETETEEPTKDSNKDDDTNKTPLQRELDSFISKLVDNIIPKISALSNPDDQREIDTTGKRFILKHKSSIHCYYDQQAQAPRMIVAVSLAFPDLISEKNAEKLRYKGQLTNDQEIWFPTYLLEDSWHPRNDTTAEKTIMHFAEILELFMKVDAAHKKVYKKTKHHFETLRDYHAVCSLTPLLHMANKKLHTITSSKYHPLPPTYKLEYPDGLQLTAQLNMYHKCLNIVPINTIVEFKGKKGPTKYALFNEITGQINKLTRSQGTKSPTSEELKRLLSIGLHHKKFVSNELRIFYPIVTGEIVTEDTPLEPELNTGEFINFLPKSDPTKTEELKAEFDKLLVNYFGSIEFKSKVNDFVNINKDYIHIPILDMQSTAIAYIEDLTQNYPNLRKIAIENFNYLREKIVSPILLEINNAIKAQKNEAENSTFYSACVNQQNPIILNGIKFIEFTKIYEQIGQEEPIIDANSLYLQD